MAIAPTSNWNFLTTLAFLECFYMVCLCQRYWPIGFYGTSKLPKCYGNDFKHDLYCCTWCWFEMSATEKISSIKGHDSKFIIAYLVLALLKGLN